MASQSRNPPDGLDTERDAGGSASAAERPRRQGPGLARVMRRRPAEVEVRKLPTQARGAATFDAILDATARLLEQGGHEIVTTNLVAEVAGVNIATLYQYFPSKEAILLALFRRDTDIRIAEGGEPIVRSARASDWRQVTSAAIDALARMRSAQRGASALRRAMRSLPELQAYERETMVGSARVIGNWLVALAGIDAERANIMGLCIVESLTALLDLWSLDDAGFGARDDRVIEELKRMINAYLEPVLGR
jgi:AcrR family transcriptional regulator